MFNASGSYTTADGQRIEGSINADDFCAAVLIGGAIMMAGIAFGFFIGSRKQSA